MVAQPVKQAGLKTVAVGIAFGLLTSGFLMLSVPLGVEEGDSSFGVAFLRALTAIPYLLGSLGVWLARRNLWLGVGVFFAAALLSVGNIFAAAFSIPGLAFMVPTFFLLLGASVAVASRFVDSTLEAFVSVIAILILLFFFAPTVSAALWQVLS